MLNIIIFRVADKYSGRMSKLHTLYAMPHSLYSGRARSYLIKRGIPFRELSTGHESFKAEVLPRGQLPTIPTLLTAGGEVIRDGAAIIEYFEASHAYPSYPAGTGQRLLSSLFDVIGTDGLLRPAMHYRWNFPEANLAFLHFHFLNSQRISAAREEKTGAMMDRMRHAAGLFGVNEGTREVVEALYLEFLEALNAHFACFPYLFGGRPSIGDFGLLAPMYAHLGRDPYPSSLMKQRALAVYRWVERMNRRDSDTPEFFTGTEEYLPDDEVPETLLSVLRVVAEDFVPETLAAAATLNEWLAEHAPDAGAPAVGRLAGPLPSCEFQLRGRTIKALAQPQRFYLLQRIQDFYRALGTEERGLADELLARCGMAKVMGAKLSRRITRKGNLEVWE